MHRNTLRSPIGLSGMLSALLLLVLIAPVGFAAYPDYRPAATLRCDATDAGRVYRHGSGPGDCDKLGARDVWVFKSNGQYFMHYDASGPKGWLSALAVSDDGVHWTSRGPVLDFGTSGSADSASASYGTVYHDQSSDSWHMFYLGTPHVTPAPDFIPSFPYLTLKATAPGPTGPWTKQYDVTPFRPIPNTYYSDTASPGQIEKQGDDYLQFFSASTSPEGQTRRTLSIATTSNLNGPWKPLDHPIVPLEEQIENSSLYFEPANQTWFLFTNHIGRDTADGGEYTDAIWVYWTHDLNCWDARKKAVVLDGKNCTWSKKCIGLPSVVQSGNRLAVYYDAPGGESTSHMNRDVGLAWLDLPLVPPDERPGADAFYTNPVVISGLEIGANGSSSITMTPGSAMVGGHRVNVKSTSTLGILPEEPMVVTGERYATLPVKLPIMYGAGTHLKGCLSTTVLPGCLDDESLVVALADGTTLTRGIDYKVDARWAGIARVDGGRISTDTAVIASYRVHTRRIDSAVISADGKISLIRGEPSKNTAKPPSIPVGSVLVANVYQPYGGKVVDTWQLLPVGKPFPAPDGAEQEANSAPVARTLQKLREGKPVTIVTWGDSVTAGGDVSSHEKMFAELFPARLRQRFPQASIKNVNAGIGATNTDGRLPALDKEVLSFKPDLVTIEFVNDIDYSASHLRKNWNEAISRIKATGAEVIVITPHFTMPDMMELPHGRGTETRPGVRTLRRIAAENHVGLADASRRWEHLETEGIPYETLLWNGINHPDDRGHELFVKELMDLFPAK